MDNQKIQEKLEQILGKMDDIVLHSPVPFYLGWEAGGRADIYIYKKHLDGLVYITGDLYNEEQEVSDAGSYELMVCHKTSQQWGPNLISNLAYYTLEASINSGETMSLGSFALPKSKIKSIIFDKYAGFKIDKSYYGLMLVIGITDQELDYANNNGGNALIEKLKEKNVYPFTDLDRNSIFE